MNFTFTETIYKSVSIINPGEVLASENLHYLPNSRFTTLNSCRQPKYSGGRNYSKRPHGVLHGREAGGEIEEEAHYGAE